METFSNSEVSGTRGPVVSFTLFMEKRVTKLFFSSCEEEIANI